jgi:hypothetical protein
MGETQGSVASNATRAVQDLRDAVAVIDNNFHVRRPGCLVGPIKADPPLIVDTDTVLAVSVTA